MNETLYSWIFNFHKVVWQQNSGAVADFILLYFTVYLRIHKWKNYWNRSILAKVIVKIKVARFLWPMVYFTFFYYNALPTPTITAEDQVPQIHEPLSSTVSCPMLPWLYTPLLETMSILWCHPATVFLVSPCLPPDNSAIKHVSTKVLGLMTCPKYYNDI